MKKFLLCLWAAAAFWPALLHGQCLTNGNFSQDASCMTTDECSTWSGDCSGWYRSHGTPQILSYSGTTPKGGKITSYYAFMWATSTVGEGMYTAFTFQAHHSYDVRVSININGGNGNMELYAANGLTMHDNDGCINDAVASISSKQEIKHYPGAFTGTVDRTFSFTADNDYTQLWVYPVGANGTQMNLDLFSILACPSCTQILTYNTGTIPTGESAAGTISAGSSAGTGGSGTVMVTAGQATTLTATNEVDLLPEFHASVTGSGTFTAQVVACDLSHNVTTESTPLDTITVTGVVQPDEFNEGMRPATRQSVTLSPDGGTAVKLQVYPTASSGAFTITGSLSDLENADITVCDEAGRNVFRSHNAENTTIQLDLGNLNNGLYFLQIRQGAKINNQKIIINR